MESLTYLYFLIFMLMLNMLTILGKSDKMLNLHIYYPMDNLVSISSTSAVFDILISTAGSQKWGYRNSTYYVFNNTDYYHNNHWIKNISIPSDYTGNLYFQLTGHMADDFSRHYSVSLCDNMFFQNQYCLQQGMPYILNVTDADSLYSLTVFPSFGNIQGETEVLFEQFYSSQLNNYRNISIYIPNSIKQNNIKRNINIFIVNDGDLDILDSFAYSGGFDVAFQSGLIPESILIGVQSIDDSTGCQRSYELTYGPCNVTLTGTEGPGGCIYDSTCYGGNNKYFDFIEQSIVPQVLSSINMTFTNEVAMIGFSLGGLTACSSVLLRPAYFKRAFCMSPSMWYNFGEFSNLVQTKTTILPDSVVMTLGIPL